MLYWMQKFMKILLKFDKILIKFRQNFDKILTNFRPAGHAGGADVAGEDARALAARAPRAGPRSAGRIQQRHQRRLGCFLRRGELEIRPDFHPITTYSDYSNCRACYASGLKGTHRTLKS